MMIMLTSWERLDFGGVIAVSNITHLHMMCKWVTFDTTIWIYSSLDYYFISWIKIFVCWTSAYPPSDSLPSGLANNSFSGFPSFQFYFAGRQHGLRLLADIIPDRLTFGHFGPFYIHPVTSAVCHSAPCRDLLRTSDFALAGSRTLGYVGFHETGKFFQPLQTNVMFYISIKYLIRT